MTRPTGPVAPDSLYARHGARVLHEKRQILMLLRALDRAGVDPGVVVEVQMPLVRLAEVDDLLTALLEALENWGCEPGTTPRAGDSDPLPPVLEIGEQARAEVRESLPVALQRQVLRALDDVVAVDAEVWTQVDELRSRPRAGAPRHGRTGAGRSPAKARRASMRPLSDDEAEDAAFRAWGAPGDAPRPTGRSQVLAFERKALPPVGSPLRTWFSRLPEEWLHGIARIHDVPPEGDEPLADRVVTRLLDPGWLRTFLVERLGASEREQLAWVIETGERPLGRRGGPWDERFAVPWDWRLERPATSGGKLRGAGLVHVGKRPGGPAIVVPPDLLEVLRRVLPEADPDAAARPARSAGGQAAAKLDGAPFDDPELDLWKRADRELGKVLESWLVAEPFGERVTAAFFGAGPRELEGDAERAAFCEFLLLDWRETPGAATRAERAFVKATFASDRHRALAQALLTTRPAIYRIDRVTRGEGFDATPLFPEGPNVSVAERALSLTLRRGDVLPLRIVPAGPFRFARLAGEPFRAGEVASVLRDLRRRQGSRGAAQFLEEDPVAFFRIVRRHAR